MPPCYTHSVEVGSVPLRPFNQPKVSMTAVQIKTLIDRYVPPPAEAVAPSLPPAPSVALPTSTLAQTVPARGGTRFPKEKRSAARKQALAILAMRAQGQTTEEIATALQIKPRSVYARLHRANAYGLLKTKQGKSLLDDPVDQIEFGIAHKAVRNMNAVLDDAWVTTESGETKPVSKLMYDATMRIAEGTLFKRFEPEAAPAAGMQLLAVKIEMPTGGAAQIRSGTMGGEGAYVEGDVNETSRDPRQQD